MIVEQRSIYRDVFDDHRDRLLARVAAAQPDLAVQVALDVPHPYVAVETSGPTVRGRLTAAIREILTGQVAGMPARSLLAVVRQRVAPVYEHDWKRVLKDLRDAGRLVKTGEKFGAIYTWVTD